jgi:hypothetical protein
MKHFSVGVTLTFGLMTAGIPFVSANGDPPPNQPKLLSPNEDNLVVMALPTGQTGMWSERVFPNDAGNHTALCLEHLTLQRVFPEAAPAVGEGVFCLWDITMIGVNEWLVPTVSLSGCLGGGNERQLLEFQNCHILAEGESTYTGGTTQNGTLRHHVFSCPGTNQALTPLGEILTSGFSPDQPVVGGSALYPVDAIFNDSGGGCACDPVVCDPCCASCPDEWRSEYQKLSQAGHVGAVELLLEHDANVNAYGPVGTALMYAAANGRVEVIRLLLEHPEIDVNRQKNGETAPDVAKGREAKKLIAHAGGRKGNSHWAYTEDSHSAARGPATPRCGRKSSGGVLTGRDPAVLPGCGE